MSVILSLALTHCQRLQVRRLVSRPRNFSGTEPSTAAGCIPEARGQVRRAPCAAMTQVGAAARTTRERADRPSSTFSFIAFATVVTYPAGGGPRTTARIRARRIQPEV